MEQFLVYMPQWQQEWYSKTQDTSTGSTPGNALHIPMFSSNQCGPWKSHFLKTMVPFPVPPCLQPQVSSKEAMTLCLSCAERSLSSWPSRSLEVSSKLRTILVSRPRASRSSFKFFDICVLASWKHYMAKWKMNIGFNEGLRDAIFQLCPDCLAKNLVSTFYESMIAIACTCKLQALQALIRIHRNECMCTLIYIYTSIIMCNPVIV